jgi:hypothetical protein
MQFPVTAKRPVGIVFDSAMNCIDDALALAMLLVLESRSDARLVAVSISQADLGAAQFCDAVRVFYARAASGLPQTVSRGLPIGLAAGQPMIPSPLWREPFAYRTNIKSVEDTADPAILIRNALTAQYDGNAVILATGPPSNLAKLLTLRGGVELVAQKVKLLCLVKDEMPADLAAWPTPIVMVGKAIGAALPFPATAIESGFLGTTAHPVVDSYRAYRPMPYDAPSSAMAAVLYSVRPSENYFDLSGPDDGKPRRLLLEPAQKERILRAYIEIATAKPVELKLKGLSAQ